MIKIYIINIIHGNNWSGFIKKLQYRLWVSWKQFVYLGW